MRIFEKRLQWYTLLASGTRDHFSHLSVTQVKAVCSLRLCSAAVLGQCLAPDLRASLSSPASGQRCHGREKARFYFSVCRKRRVPSEESVSAGFTVIPGSRACGVCSQIAPVWRRQPVPPDLQSSPVAPALHSWGSHFLLSDFSEREGKQGSGVLFCVLFGGCKTENILVVRPCANLGTGLKLLQQK